MAGFMGPERFAYAWISDAARIIRGKREPGSKEWKKMTFEHVRTIHDMEVMLRSLGSALTAEKADYRAR